MSQRTLKSIKHVTLWIIDVKKENTNWILSSNKHGLRYLGLVSLFIQTHAATHTISFSLTQTNTYTSLYVTLVRFLFLCNYFLSTSCVTCCSHWLPPRFLLYRLSVTVLPLLLPSGSQQSSMHGTNPKGVEFCRHFSLKRAVLIEISILLCHYRFGWMY